MVLETRSDSRSAASGKPAEDTKGSSDTQREQPVVDEQYPPGQRYHLGDRDHLVVPEAGVVVAVEAEQEVVVVVGEEDAVGNEELAVDGDHYTADEMKTWLIEASGL